VIWPIVTSVGSSPGRSRRASMGSAQEDEPTRYRRAGCRPAGQPAVPALAAGLDHRQLVGVLGAGARQRRGADREHQRLAGPGRGRPPSGHPAPLPPSGGALLDGRMLQERREHCGRIARVPGAARPDVAPGHGERKPSRTAGRLPRPPPAVPDGITTGANAKGGSLIATADTGPPPGPEGHPMDIGIGPPFLHADPELSITAWADAQRSAASPASTRCTAWSTTVTSRSPRLAVAAGATC
jgi:hypothetical protein